jgi:serine/threonine protein kinase
MTMLTKHLMEDPVAPSMRRPDLPISPEMDALVLKALEKDREKRWQSMAELLEAVSSCPGPENAPNRQPVKGQTIAMGGAHAPAAVLPKDGGQDSRKPSRRIGETVGETVSSSAAMESPRGTASSKKTVVMIGTGVALGIGVAAWLALSSRGKPAEAISTASPAAVVQPSAPTPPPPPAPSAPAPVIPSAATAPAPVPPIEEKPGSAEAANEPIHKRAAERGRKGKGAAQVAASAAKPVPEAGKPAAPAESKPAPPSSPGELKPFPKL